MNQAVNQAMNQAMKWAVGRASRPVPPHDHAMLSPRLHRLSCGSRSTNRSVSVR